MIRRGQALKTLQDKANIIIAMLQRIMAAQAEDDSDDVAASGGSHGSRKRRKKEESVMGVSHGQEEHSSSHAGEPGFP